MGLANRVLTSEELLKRSEEEREHEHYAWLARKVYFKTGLQTFMNCREKFRMKYDERADEFWGIDLIEGISGHKAVEVFHTRLLEGKQLYPVETREIIKAELVKLKHKLDSSVPLDVDGSIGRILPLVELYARSWKRWFPEVKGVELVFGIDAPVQMGGKNIAGHVDLETTDRLVVDHKFVGKQSGHRKEKKFDLGMEMYKLAMKAKATAMLPFVKDPYKREPEADKEQALGRSAEGIWVIDGLKKVHHTPQTALAAEELVHGVAEEIEKGNLFGGPPEIGNGLCVPQYCSFFGRCRLTKHLSRESFKKKED